MLLLPSSLNGKEDQDRETPEEEAKRLVEALTAEDEDQRVRVNAVRELAADLKTGKVRNPGGLARSIVARLRVNPNDVRREPVEEVSPGVAFVRRFRAENARPRAIGT